MATYTEIQNHIKDNYDFYCKKLLDSCWIADMKEFHKLNLKVAHNRHDRLSKKVPCPSHRREAVTETFKHFGIINDKKQPEI